MPAPGLARQAVEVNPELAPAWLTLAELAAEQRRRGGGEAARREVEAALERAVAINPRLADEAAELRAVDREG